MIDIIGYDIGGTKTAVILGNSNGIVYKRVEFETQSYKQTIDMLFRTTYQMLSDANIQINQIKAIGIACGGPLDAKNGIVLSPPNLPDWVNIPIVRIVSEELKIPCYLENDANAGALAEWKFGAGKGCDNLIFLTFGTGMGAGLILNGQLYVGTNGMGGEVGHIRLENDGPVGFRKKGSFEGFCSGGGIMQLARKIVADKLLCNEKVSFCDNIENSYKLTAKDIGIAANNNDPVALEIWDTVGYHLGKGLAILVDILNPQKIILGSIYIKSGKYISNAMYKRLKQEAISYSLECLEILPAGLGNAIGDYQSIAVAANGMDKLY